MDERVKELMNITPIVTNVMKRTGLSLEELDQRIGLTTSIIPDDDGEPVITFLANTTHSTKPGFMADAYEFAIARKHFELLINHDAGEKKIIQALEVEFKELELRAHLESEFEFKVAQAATFENEIEAMQLESERLRMEAVELAIKLGEKEERAEEHTRQAVEDSKRKQTEAARMVRQENAECRKKKKMRDLAKIYDEELKRESTTPVITRVAERVFKSESHTRKLLQELKEEMRKSVRDENTEG
ncbi:hypothetical protein JD422_07145 [Leclercia adecarboxylata]|nr:hypothetical protein [Leclercia adecarboxylata]MBK0350415.1 hypothetical protein [Leclercia adecarboxylata]